jgi:hypothetical protein
LGVLERLCEIVSCAQLDGALDVIWRISSCQGHDRNSCSCVVPPQFLQNAETIEFRHVDVEEYGSRRIVPDAPNGFPTITPKRYIVVCQQKPGPNQFQH